MDWNNIIGQYGPHIISGIAIYAGIRADMKLMRFQIDTLWKERFRDSAVNSPE